MEVSLPRFHRDKYGIRGVACMPALLFEFTFFRIAFFRSTMIRVRVKMIRVRLVNQKCTLIFLLYAYLRLTKSFYFRLPYLRIAPHSNRKRRGRALSETGYINYEVNTMQNSKKLLQRKWTLTRLPSQIYFKKKKEERMKEKEILFRAGSYLSVSTKLDWKDPWGQRKTP